MTHDLRTQLFSILEKFEISKYKQTEFGLLAVPNPEIAELAYEVKINNPLTVEEIGELFAIGRNCSEEALIAFYTAFNGFDLRMSKMTCYGLIRNFERSDYFSIQNVPYDLKQLQTYGRPEHSPSEGLVFGSSRFETNTSEEDDIISYYVLLNDGSVQVGKFDISPHTEKLFPNIVDWLAHEVPYALRLQSD